MIRLIPWRVDCHCEGEARGNLVLYTLGEVSNDKRDNNEDLFGT